ncbi:MAG: cytochrome C peroxidase [Pedosphaera sp.]|nr:cytochrome C peroxidase [Pedosphaera sp.]
MKFPAPAARQRSPAARLAALLLALSCLGASAAHLAVEIQPRFRSAPLVFDAATNTTAAGQKISVTRLDFLLSNIALRRADGSWLSPPDWFAFLSAREGRTSFRLEGIPAGRYDRLRFNIGVPEKENHANPGGLPATHPLNPNVNGLHWSWQGGYVFLAIEGDWLKPDGRPSGYSYHVATDRLLMSVELPVALDLATDRALRLALHVDQIFSSKHAIKISDDTTSTHSRPEDRLAGQLRENLERAFTVETIGGLPATTLAGRTNGRPAKPLVAAAATPYRFTFSGFFPQPALPLDNPLTVEGVELGRRLFHDPLLSINQSQSCASCHQAGHGFTDALKFSVGAEGRAGTRNAMPLHNLAWKNSFFWDGRAATLRQQVLEPIQNPVELHESLTNVVAKLAATGRAGRPLPAARTNANDGAHGVARPTTNYPSLFTRAFGTPDISADRIARALEQFLLTQVSHHSKFDRSLAGEVELTAEEKRGFELFNTEYDPRHEQFGADCFHCHGGPLFQSQGFANNGLDLEARDAGRHDVTKRPGDFGKFSVPSLRNIALTAPYMHDGRFATLEQVIEHYSTGVKRSATLDPNLAKHPDGGLRLNAADQRALVAFLKTLTDARFQTNLSADAKK